MLVQASGLGVYKTFQIFYVTWLVGKLNQNIIHYKYFPIIYMLFSSPLYNQREDGRNIIP